MYNLIKHWIAYAVHENMLLFPRQFIIWPWNTDKMRFNTYIYIYCIHNKFCRKIEKYNKKMAYLSDFKRQKSEKHRTASRLMTNWAEPPCDTVEIIHTEEWYSCLSDYRKYIKVVII